MKLAEMEMTEGESRITGNTSRLGKTIISVAMTPNVEAVEVLDMLPRLFLKITPDQGSPDGVGPTVIKKTTRPEVLSKLVSSGEVFFEPSDDDPLSEPNIMNVLGATFTTGH